ncbi:MAG: hypothetical protein RMN25_11935 [Anaerolineae bacterium]|nr:hypothetical protein [Thermoflexales bacterium]MDW8408480.1 hypothetical protein [Anaerolineae bacterium]
MSQMERAILAGLCVLAIAGSGGCKVAESVARPVQRSANQNAAARLWRDVPPLADATLVELDLPFLLRLALYSAAGDLARDSNLKLNSFDFVIYQVDATPEDVQTFYTAERMAGAGWNAERQPGCTQTASLGGVLCTFARSAGDRHTALFIVAGRDDPAKPTYVYYVRFDSTRISPTATPNR